MLTIPYVTPAAFRAHPTYLDTLSLRPGDASVADQDRELTNILLMASAKADNYVEMSGDGESTLAAHTRIEQLRVRVGRDGTVKYKPDHYPVTALTKLEWGTSPANLTAVTDYSGVWIEKSRTVVAPLSFGAAGLGPAFQFGAATATSEVYTRWTYTAGYTNTLIAAAVAAGATAVTVRNPAGITGGSATQRATVLRIWEPGVEEAVTVDASYVPGSATVPLTAPLLFAHTADAGISALPADAHLAVIFYAIALLDRPDSEAEDAFPNTKASPNTQTGSSGPVGLVVEAERLLEVLRRVR
jgi:hypothetical protein